MCNSKNNFLFVDVLKELVLLSPHDFLHTLVPFLQHNHCTYHHSNIPSRYFSDCILKFSYTIITLSCSLLMSNIDLFNISYFILTYTTVSLGPYFPCRDNLKLIGGKSNIRPPRPELNMCLLPTMVEASKVCKRAV